MKQCTHCKEFKDRALFNNHPHTSDGLQSWCKACQKASASEYQRTHRPQINEANRWRRSHPGEARPRTRPESSCCISGECDVCLCCQGFCPDHYEKPLPT